MSTKFRCDQKNSKHGSMIPQESEDSKDSTLCCLVSKPCSMFMYTVTFLLLVLLLRLAQVLKVSSIGTLADNRCGMWGG